MLKLAAVAAVNQGFTPEFLFPFGFIVVAGLALVFYIFGGFDAIRIGRERKREAEQARLAKVNRRK